MVEFKASKLLAGVEFKKTDTAVIVAGTLATAIGIFMYNLFNSIYYMIIAGIGASLMFYTIMRPILERDSAKSDINSNIPYFMTAFATLSVSAANRIDLLDILSKKEKLGRIRLEIARLVNLVKNWKRGLSEAAMLISTKVPSEVFEDFLARFGHAINSGQDFEDFVKNESETVMNNFETAYISSLYTFDLYKDMYVSLLLAFAFMITFIMIMPVLISINVLSVLSLSLITIILGESMLVYGIKIVLPNDPIWHDTGIKTELQLKIRRVFIYASIAAAVIFATLYVTRFIFELPFYLALAMIVTPFFFPGYIGSKAEKKVMKKDEMFGSFIRSLAGSASARGNMVIEALKSIVLHDFGTLTKDIRNLYNRLAYRINSIQAWRYFSADTGSHLIEVFSESFVESIDLGADAAKAGTVVADNFDRVIRLRKRRHASVNSYVGVIYGITGGLAFSLAISFGVLEIINKVFATFNVSTLDSYGIFVSQPASSILLIEVFLVAILLIHSFIAGTALKFADGGKVVHGLHHFVIMTWIVSLVMYGTLYLTSIMLGGAL
ncbi:MAG: archaellar assembly protein FlaJ [Candidatus Thermoplasmatota archaeon]|nr:archaellar assembly protein FlaJ [Candidatus Thermoplasmatota archaeon]